MFLPVRAAAFAATAFAFVASPFWTAPLSAQTSAHADAATPSVAAFYQHADANPLGLAEGARAVAQAPASPARDVRPLAEQVTSLAAAETNGAEQECLANAVYFEARGEPLEGQLAVAEVVMNRAASGRYPSTLCAVVRQHAQFSFVRGGVIPRADRNSEAWRRAVAVARVAQTGTNRLLPDNVLWYHANYVAPSWGRRLSRSGRIGAHIFYR
jgi:spore germination cell wall hydrolase CwlJ-like protein